MVRHRSRARHRCKSYVQRGGQIAQCDIGENAVMRWVRFAVESTTVGRPPVDSEYLISLASLAALDALLAIEAPGKYEPYASSPVVVQPASSDAAVATAAFEVLRIRVPAQASVLQGKYSTFMAARAGAQMTCLDRIGPTQRRGLS
jgi:hypothetical protein